MYIETFADHKIQEHKPSCKILRHPVVTMVVRLVYHT